MNDYSKEELKDITCKRVLELKDKYKKRKKFGFVFAFLLLFSFGFLINLTQDKTEYNYLINGNILSLNESIQFLLLSMIIILFFTLVFFAQSYFINEKVKEFINKKKEIKDIVFIERKNIKSKIMADLKSHPLFALENKITSIIEFLKEKKEHEKVEYENLSWGGKFLYEINGGSSNVDSDISKMERIKEAFYSKHYDDLVEIRKKHEKRKILSMKRLDNHEKNMYEFVDFYYNKNQCLPNEKGDKLFKMSCYASLLGVSYSIWDDFMITADIYEALRSVNGNFKELSDFEIWTETLFMEENSLLGLASLTKGAYFEQLVEKKTGGELFEHFNNPDTDIVIDGIEYQIKATDSIDYINTVDENIPLISTTEVSNQIDSLDIGISNSELDSEIDMAVNGLGFDSEEAIFDGVCSGIGGLGFFATINGINHAFDKYNSGATGDEALIEGIDVAVKGTAKAFFDGSELIYKGLTSKPSRAVGRGFVNMAKKIDDKFSNKG